MGWSGKKIKDTFKDLLKINSASDNDGIDSTLREVQDGNGDNTGLKLSSTAVDAATLTSTNATITTINNTTLTSNTVDINGGAIDGTTLGVDNPSRAVTSSLGIGGPASYQDTATNFSIHTTEGHSNTAKAPALMGRIKTYHELHGYFTVNIDNKFNWTGLEFLPTNFASKGCAWFELELFVDESDSSAVAAGGGSGYSTAPKVTVVPRQSLEDFGGTGAWTANTSVGNGAKCVYYGIPSRPNIGYVYQATTPNYEYAYTGSDNPFVTGMGNANDYTHTVNDNNIVWKYRGLTGNVITSITGGAVDTYTVGPDYETNPSITIVSRFIFESVSDVADWFNDDCFFNVATHLDDTEPITLEKGITGGTAASTVGIDYYIGAYDASEGGFSWINSDSITLTLRSGGNGSIVNGEDWAVCQRNLSGTLLRHVKVKASTQGGRAGTCILAVESPDSGITAVANPSYVNGYARGGTAWDVRGVGGATPATHIGEQDPARFEATGERSYFGTYKGFIMSRDSYDHNLGSISDGVRRWWADNRQREFKKAKILDGIKYGHTNLGHMHNFDPTLIEKNADASIHAKNKFDQAAGRIYTLSGTVGSYSIAEDTTKRIFFHSSDGSEEKLFSTLSFGGNADYKFCKSAWDIAYDAAIAGSSSVDDAIIAAKAAILDWPNFGNLTGGFAGGTRPGGHCQINPVMFSALDVLQVSFAADGAANLSLPEGSNEGSFYITFSSSYTGTSQEVGIGYRLKCWTTPGYISNLRRVTTKFD